MRKTIMLATVTAIAFTGPAFAQAVGSPSAAPAGTTGNTPGGPDSPQNGAAASAPAGGAMARHAQSAPAGQMAPNGNAGAKVKSGANGG